MLSLCQVLASLWGMGDNANYNLGNGTNTAVASFDKIGTNSPTLVSPNQYGTFILDSNIVASSGVNTYKQLGSTKTEVHEFEQSVYSVEKIVEFQQGRAHSVFRDLAGSVFGSGSNARKQLEPNDGAASQESYDKVKIRTSLFLDSGETVQQVLAWKDATLIVATQNVYVLGDCAACDHSVRGVSVLNIPVSVSEIRNLTAFTDALVLVTKAQQIYALGQIHCAQENQNAFTLLPFGQITQMGFGTTAALFIQEERIILCQDGTHRMLGSRLPQMIAIQPYKSGAVILTALSTVYYCDTIQKLEDSIETCAVAGDFTGVNSIASYDANAIFLYPASSSKSYYVKQVVAEANAQNVVSGKFLEAVGETAANQYPFKEYSSMPKIAQYTETTSGFLAVSQNKKLYAGGTNAGGELGFSTKGNLGTKPVIVPFFQDLEVQSVYSSGDLTVATMSDAVYVFGAPLQQLKNFLADSFTESDFGSPRKLDLSFLESGDTLKLAWPLGNTIYCLTAKRLMRVAPDPVYIDADVAHIARVEPHPSAAVVIFTDGTARLIGQNSAGELCNPRTQSFLTSLSPKIQFEDIQRVAVGNKMTLISTVSAVYFCGQNYYDSIGKAVKVVGSQSVSFWEYPVQIRSGASVDVGVTQQFLTVITTDNIYGKGDRRITSSPYSYLGDWQKFGSFNLQRVQGSVLTAHTTKPINNEDSQIIYKWHHRHFTLIEQLMIVIVTFITVIMLAVGALVALLVLKKTPPGSSVMRSAKMRKVAEQVKTQKMI